MDVTYKVNDITINSKISDESEGTIIINSAQKRNYV